MIAAIDTETTGLKSGYHELISIAIVPLDENFDPVGTPFHTFSRPLHPDRMSVKALSIQGVTMAEVLSYPSREEAVAKFLDWYTQSGSPFIEPLGHNFGFDRGMITHWLDDIDKYISHRDVRDSQNTVKAYNDVFGTNIKRGLRDVMYHFGYEMPEAHDALGDALASALVYKTMIGELRVRTNQAR